MYAARHCSNLPAGFSWPAPAPRSEATAFIPASAVRVAIATIQDKLRPAWEVHTSGAVRPSRADCLRWAGMAHAYRKAERRSYALAWLMWCFNPEGEAPSLLAHRIPANDARAIRQRFADDGLFDPRDFHNVPF
jgi:hypothetical protein